MTDFDLRAFREKHSFSQTDLAELWDITQNMISKFEQADTPPAITRYAARALEEELTGERQDAETADTQPLQDRIAELEAQLVDTNSKLIEANNKLLAVPQTDKPIEQPKRKPRSGLGRAKGATRPGEAQE